MNCMKCGRETQEETVFCQNCLAVMEKYPVQPGTVVLLPRRRESSLPKKITKRHVPTAEEQVVFLRKWVVILMILLVASIAAIALMFNPTLYYIQHDHFEIGQNYSSITSSNPTSAE